MSCAAFLLQGCAETATVDSGVFVLEANAESPRRLGGPAGAPVWAPSGDAVAWTTDDGLFLHDLENGEPALLATHAAAGRPTWSPDGRAIAYVDREAESLVALDADTGEILFSTQLATEDAGHQPLALPVLGGPSWSPDGSRLAFNCWDGHGDEVCVIRSDGTGFRQVTHIQNRKSSSDPLPGALVLATSNAGPVAWSPDGTELALAVYPEQRGAAAGVFVVDLEGGTARRVSSLLPNSEIVWIEDGASLLFSASDRGRSDAMKVPVTAGEAEMLTANLANGAREPTLSADETRLAVASGGNIVMMDLAGNVKGSIEGGLGGRSPAWSSTGDRIAFSAAPDPIASYS